MASTGATVLQGISQLAGGAFQFAGNKQAAKAQSEAAANALDFEKQRYQNIITALAPYVATGQNANQRAAKLLGVGTQQFASFAQPLVPPGGQPPAAAAPPAPPQEPPDGE